MYYVDERWGAICPKTGKHFRFDAFYQVSKEITPEQKRIQGENPFYRPYETKHIRETLRYPNGNPSVVEIQCPFCEDHSMHRFNNEDLSRPASILDAEEKEREEELKTAQIYEKDYEKQVKDLEKQLTQAKGQLEKEREANQKRLDEKDKILDKRLGDLTEAYMSLAKFVHEDLPRMFSQNPKKEKPNYEGPQT